MAQSASEVRVSLSVLDRLLDDEPQNSQEALLSRSRSMQLLRQAVRRDLEWLLNTRQRVGGVPAELALTSHSLAAYGLPDFTNLNTKSPQDRFFLRNALEETVINFEPRLENVVVRLLPEQDTEHALHFRIDAWLKVDPVPEPVTFDTTLRLSSGEYLVKG
jgi:type VI secretion system protein ImpF